MSRWLRICLISVAMALVMGTLAFAAAKTDLKAASTGFNPTDSGFTTLIWTPTASGTDSIEVSLDGATWVLVTTATTPVKLAAAPAPYGPDPALMSVKAVGMANFTNYYFRIKNDDAGTITYSNVADAFPPNEHAHKFFGSDTNQCAKCHATHTGEGAKLLQRATVDDTCKTCHAGSGSKYQVDVGKVDNGTVTKLDAPAGPFGQVITPASLVVPTSAHIVSAPINSAPGGNTTATEAVWTEPLGCGSCHSAHPPRGYAGVTKTSYQYRLLKTLLPEWYNPTTQKYDQVALVEAYAVTLADKEGVNYVSGLNQFCGGCHTDFNTTGVVGSGEDANGKYSMKTRHAVGIGPGWHPQTVLPFEGPGTWDGSKAAFAGNINCATCHRTHGTTTTNTDPGTTFNLPDSRTFTNYSHLLRLDNRAVCQQCHNK